MRRLRRAANLTIADVADAMGCSIVYVSDIERGQRNPPSREMLKKALKAMGCMEHLSELDALSTRSRKSIEIPIAGKREDEAAMVAALARRCDEDALSPEEIHKIIVILRKGKDK